MASSFCSPVRMRTTRATSKAKILPSPILPVCAVCINGTNAVVDDIIRHYQFHFYLGQKIHHIFRTVVPFRVHFLADKTQNFVCRHPSNADFPQRFAHVVQFEGFNNGIDFSLLHILSRLPAPIVDRREQGAINI